MRGCQGEGGKDLQQGCWLGNRELGEGGERSMQCRYWELQELMGQPRGDPRRQEQVGISGPVKWAEARQVFGAPRELSPPPCT